MLKRDLTNLVPLFQEGFHLYHVPLAAPQQALLRPVAVRREATGQIK